MAIPHRLLQSRHRVPLIESSCVPKSLTADDILPIIASLTPGERVRLIRLIASGQESDSCAYAAMPPRPDEFQSDDDLLSWDAEGWEQFS